VQYLSIRCLTAGNWPEIFNEKEANLFLEVVLVACDACNIQYVGQTTQEMRRRHYGHQRDKRNGIARLGSHF
jgi:hypothetical protein